MSSIYYTGSKLSALFKGVLSIYHMIIDYSWNYTNKHQVLSAIVEVSNKCGGFCKSWVTKLCSESSFIDRAWLITANVQTVDEKVN